jgi:hypothetical protein
MLGSGTFPALGSNTAVFELAVEPAGGAVVPELQPKTISIGRSIIIFFTVLYIAVSFLTN